MYFNCLQLCEILSHKFQLPSGWSFNLWLCQFLLDMHANGAFREPALLKNGMKTKCEFKGLHTGFIVCTYVSRQT